MALRKPLVINNGNIQQLQSGDTLDAVVTEVDHIDVTNNQGATINICQPVYVDAAGTVKLAQADALATSEVLGLVKDSSIGSGNSGTVQTDGKLTATTGEWDAVTGGSGGLTAGSVYFLDPDTAGNLTDTAPTTTGDLVARVGLAVSTTELVISRQPPILL